MTAFGEFGQDRAQLVSGHRQIPGLLVEEDVDEQPAVEIAVDHIQQVIAAGAGTR